MNWRLKQIALGEIPSEHVKSLQEEVRKKRDQRFSLINNWESQIKAEKGKLPNKREEKTEITNNFMKLEEDNETRNILLIGRTGSGKSTLANVLVNKNGNFEEIFKESSYSVSETKSIQTERFEIKLNEDGSEKIKYLIIDTAGFGDTQLNNKEVLKLLSEMVRVIGNNGLNQIFFVTGGRFTQPEIETYKLLESTIFDKSAVDHTTIIRTNFPAFEDKKKCEMDQNKLLEENRGIFEILGNRRVIYVDNPPVSDHYSDMAKVVRESSWRRLITYLGTCQNIYHPSDLENFSERIENYMSHEEELENDLRLKEEVIKGQEMKLQEEVKTLSKQKDRELKITQKNFERQIIEAKKQSDKELQEERDRLQRKYQWQINESQEKYSSEQSRAESRRQREIDRIKSRYETVRIGDVYCSQGHDNVEIYKDLFITHIYCYSCGRTDHDYELRNSYTITFEEWCRRKSKNHADEINKMNQQIQDQEHYNREVISRIKQEKTNRESTFQKELEQQKQTKEQIINQQKRINEEMLKQEKLTREGKIISGSQEKEEQLRKELVEMKQKLEEQINQSKARRDASERELQTYIEQKSNYRS